MNYLKLITILAVIGVTLVRGQQSDDDVDDIIGSIFNLTNNNGNNNGDNGNNGDVVEPAKNIICVPYNLCDGETNKIITDGSEDGAFLIDIR